ncbi:hypothetical protein HRI_002628100 [Hibiscus trionum]|uniref:RNase H type-1 domain-containing protein n=1 Tax=Hibiscus trionum TaxID=183268 RepID=A0A9W7I7W5_HIBTR|nr:hypothetical protein HRI_002628100 [Hibiscus trionum]
MELNVLSSRLAPRPSDFSRTWVSSPPSLCKINVDANFKPTEFVAGLGAVILDEEGHILGAQCSLANHVPPVFAAESLAARWGLRFAHDLGIRQVILEGDALTIIKKLQMREEDLSEISAIIYDTKSLARDFQEFQLSFIPRSGNRVAHAFINERFSLSKDHAWIEEAPDHILALIDEDRRYSDPP